MDRLKIVHLMLVVGILALLTFPIVTACVTPPEPPGTPEPPSQEPKDQEQHKTREGAYLVEVHIKGLPRTYETTIFIDGKRWGSCQGGSSLTVAFRAKTLHEISVQTNVDGFKGEFEVINDVAEIAAGGTCTFRYTQMDV